jgi:cell division protein FtsW
MTVERKCDRWLLIITLLLTGMGVLMVYSSTSVVTPSLAKKNVSEYYYLKKHIFTIFMGFTVMLMAYRVRPEHLRKLSIPLLAVSFVLLLLVFVPGFGVSAGGAKRWLRLWPSTFQPSELVKLAMVIFLAWYISYEGFNKKHFMFLTIPVGIMAVFQVVFLKQPDFGAVLSLGALTIGMLFIAGVPLKYLTSLLVLCVPVLAKLLMEPYRFKRILAFLDPWKHARDSGFQLVQSFIALGNGGLTGVGLGQSRQKLDFLPEVHTDFIFSLVGEEMGFIVAVAVVAMFTFMFFRGIAIANNAGSGFRHHLCFGLSMMLAFQALVNFMVVVGLLPTKGLPLPFLSYGGSALLVNMIAIGILLNVSRLDPADADNGQSESRLLLEERMLRKRARRSVYGAQQ